LTNEYEKNFKFKITLKITLLKKMSNFLTKFTSFINNLLKPSAEQVEFAMANNEFGKMYIYEKMPLAYYSDREKLENYVFDHPIFRYYVEQRLKFAKELENFDNKDFGNYFYSLDQIKEYKENNVHYEKIMASLNDRKLPRPHILGSCL